MMVRWSWPFSSGISEALRLSTLSTLAFLALWSTARAEIVEIAWDTDGRFERQLSLAPGRFTELCGRLTARTKVQWRFDSEAATDFNVHFHVAKVVRYAAKKDAVTGAGGTLDVSREEDYCWMWSNVSTTPVVVKVHLVLLGVRCVPAHRGTPAQTPSATAARACG